MINGEIYDFESVKIGLPSGQTGTCESVKYNVKKDVEIINDQNGVPRGYIRKGLESDFEMDMSLDEFERLNRSAMLTGILGMDPFPVTVNYGDGGKPVIKDKMTVKITETPREAKKDSEIRMTIKGKIVDVPVFNGIPVYVV